MSKVASLNVPSDIVAADRKPTDLSSEAMRSRVRRRYLSERICRTTGFLAVSLSVLFLAFLLSDMLSKGASGFQQAEIAVPVTLDSGELMLTKAQLQGPEADAALAAADRSEEHTSELQSLMRISYAVFCLQKKKLSESSQAPDGAHEQPPPQNEKHPR